MKYANLNLGQIEAIGNRLGGERGIDRFLAGELIVSEKPRPTTEPRTFKVLRPMDLPAAPATFSADETFFAKKPCVKISYLGDNFRSWFAGAVEENAPSAPLVGFDLTQSAEDSEIIEDLGGEARAEVTLCEIWRLMQRQSSGEGGVLLTNGYANVFCVRGKDGVLRTVSVYWDGLGWGVDADALGDSRWLGGHRVFSRNS